MCVFCSPVLVKLAKQLRMLLTQVTVILIAPISTKMKTKLVKLSKRKSAAVLSREINCSSQAKLVYIRFSTWFFQNKSNVFSLHSSLQVVELFPQSRTSWACLEENTGTSGLGIFGSLSNPLADGLCCKIYSRTNFLFVNCIKSLIIN